MTRVFIDGAAGTTGLDIADRLAERADLDLIVLPEAERKLASARRDALNDADVVILCLPDDAAREAVAMIDAPHVRVIDASTAYRTNPDWIYGFAEYAHGQRGRIAEATRLSNPGCYPTGFLALLAPLVAGGLLPADHGYSVNAVSGYSGGGKALIARVEEEADLAFRSYGLDLAHKHVPEMQVHAGLAHAPLFAPSVTRAFRGMIVEVPLLLDTMRAAPVSELRAALAAHYRDEQVVRFHDDVPSELLLREDAAPSDRLDLYLATNAEGTRARLIATLDNLGKGAGGAAVQNLNIMTGAAETLGLRL